MSIVSDGVRLVRIFAEVPWERASNNSGGIENRNFQRFLWLFFVYFRDEASVIVYRYAVRRLFFSDHKMRDHE